MWFIALHSTTLLGIFFLNYNIRDRVATGSFDKTAKVFNIIADLGCKQWKTFKNLFWTHF
jgi:hypothetical protein